jgi:uncharacterized membrane protein
MKKEILIKSAIAAFFTITSANIAFADDAKTSTEKCYGVVKTGMNDCQTATASCAGSSTKDSQADAFVLVPAGLCEKLVGGHLKPATKTTN